MNVVFVRPPVRGHSYNLVFSKASLSRPLFPAPGGIYLDLLNSLHRDIKKFRKKKMLYFLVHICITRNRKVLYWRRFPSRYAQLISFLKLAAAWGPPRERGAEVIIYKVTHSGVSAELSTRIQTNTNILNLDYLLFLGVLAPLVLSQGCLCVGLRDVQTVNISQD